ncbi:hypothetical protein SXIM_38120 [Streptomyces xiamenensis]|uniref:Uncharacterized protein n=1 Tax=Streptomyces xiamenensis TaxID=408015 RepID=A0A0F7CPT0_9ACTN|nr:hypothetical protein [Streptomyces xiamenensis]AKG45196.1 hypothetical protein SXIM_38120 [Streptomyces xiamenensis]
MVIVIGVVLVLVVGSIALRAFRSGFSAPRGGRGGGSPAHTDHHGGNGGDSGSGWGWGGGDSDSGSGGSSGDSGGGGGDGGGGGGD